MTDPRPDLPPDPFRPPRPTWRDRLPRLRLPTSPWLIAAWVAGGLAGILALTLMIAVVLVWPELPDLDRVENYHPHEPLKILTHDGLEIGEFGPEHRDFVPISKMPLLMQNAVIATEDADFWHHDGISIKGIARAFIANLRHVRSQGGSTITQQVARNFYLSRRKSYTRKFSEILLALKMERALTKGQILELYMNQIYLGQRAYGFEAAARTYFGKSVDQLTVAEAAVLAGLPQNPYYANPISHLDRAVARQHVVLLRMRETGVITQAQYQAALAQPLVIARRTGPPVDAAFLAEMVRQQVVARFGDQAYQRGLRVTTTIDSTDQNAAVDALRHGLLAFDGHRAWRGPEDVEDLPDDDTDIDQAAAQALKGHDDDDLLHVAIVLHASPREVEVAMANGDRVTLKGAALRLIQGALRPRAPAKLAVTRGAILRLVQDGKGWRVSQWPDIQAALVSMDTHTGDIRALVGGFDFDHSKFNHVTSAWRQPGSSFKPFVYSAALEQGIMPETLVSDAPMVFDRSAGGGQDWIPKDFEDSAPLPMTVRKGLAESRNLVAIRVLQTVGVGTVRDWVTRFGIDRDRQPDNLTMGLGAGSVTPAQMVDAYSVFANGGYRVEPRFIEKITDPQGKVLFQAPPPAPLSEAARVIPARNAFMMDQLLQEVTRSGTAAAAQAELKRPDVFGKTGTTNDEVDAWFAGFHPSLATVVWVGHDTPSTLGRQGTGAGAALPIWIDYMRTALKDVPVSLPEPPPGVAPFQGDWIYDDYVDGGYVQSIGVQPGMLAAMVPPVAASGASAPASSAASGGPGAAGGVDALATFAQPPQPVSGDQLPLVITAPRRASAPLAPASGASAPSAAATPYAAPASPRAPALPLSTLPPAPTH